MPKKNTPPPNPTPVSQGGDEPPRALRLAVVPNMAAAPFGEMLRTARRTSNRTQVDVAAKMRISQGYLAHLENGAFKPTLDTLAKFAAALDCEISLTLAPSAARKRPPTPSSRKEE